MAPKEVVNSRALRMHQYSDAVTNLPLPESGDRYVVCRGVRPVRDCYGQDSSLRYHGHTRDQSLDPPGFLNKAQFARQRHYDPKRRGAEQQRGDSPGEARNIMPF